MTRYIDADALETHEQLEPMGNGNYEFVEVVYKDDIDDVPTADVVEVVRCKDCKHWHSNTEFCGIWSFNFQNIAQRTLRDDYCSRAERREE